MITYDEVKALSGYTSKEGVAISFYLNADSHNKDSQGIETKDMIKNARKDLEGLSLNRSYLRAAGENLERIQKFISLNIFTEKFKSTAIFANGSGKFFRAFRLPTAVKSKLIIDTTFHVDPLLALLEEHYRIGVVLVDSRQARFFEIYMGEILEHLDFSTAGRTPKKPLLETFMKRQKRLAQKKEEEVRVHLSSVAERLKAHFSMRHFDKLIIGAKKPLGDHLKRLLNPRLTENLIGVYELDTHATEGEILSKTSSVEKEFELQQENRLLRKITNEIERNGHAVRGLKDVVEAAQEYSLQEVAVADDFSQAGFICSGCAMPHVMKMSSEEEATCVSCSRRLIHVQDIVYHIVEEATRQNATVRHIRGTNLIGSLENIAAVIKFKKDKSVKIEEAVRT